MPMRHYPGEAQKAANPAGKCRMESVSRDLETEWEYSVQFATLIALYVSLRCKGATK